MGLSYSAAVNVMKDATAAVNGGTLSVRVVRRHGDLPKVCYSWCGLRYLLDLTACVVQELDFQGTGFSVSSAMMSPPLPSAPQASDKPSPVTGLAPAARRQPSITAVPRERVELHRNADGGFGFTPNSVLLSSLMDAR